MTGITFFDDLKKTEADFTETHRKGKDTVTRTNVNQEKPTVKFQVPLPANEKIV
jgi:hypothetical protein